MCGRNVAINIKATIVRETIKLNLLYRLSTMINIFHDTIATYERPFIHYMPLSAFFWHLFFLAAGVMIMQHSSLFTCGAKLLNADWLCQRTFFLNHDSTFGNQKGMITWCCLVISCLATKRYCVIEIFFRNNGFPFRWSWRRLNWAKAG